MGDTGVGAIVGTTEGTPVGAAEGFLDANRFREAFIGDSEVSSLDSPAVTRIGIVSSQKDRGKIPLIVRTNSRHTCCHSN